MSNLTNKSRLTPNAPPDAPPWRWIDTRTLQAWLGVSAQSVVNWRACGTGPAYRQDTSKRNWYRKAEVEHWLDGPSSPVAEDRIRDWITASQKPAAEAAWGLQPPSLIGEAHRLLVRSSDLSTAELARLTVLLDKTGAYGTPHRRPKRFLTNAVPTLLIGYEAVP